MKEISDDEVERYRLMDVAAEKLREAMGDRSEGFVEWRVILDMAAAAKPPEPAYVTLVSDDEAVETGCVGHLSRVGALYLRKAADRLEKLSYLDGTPETPSNVALRIAADQLRGWADQEEKL